VGVTKGRGGGTKEVLRWGGWGGFNWWIGKLSLATEGPDAMKLFMRNAFAVLIVMLAGVGVGHALKGNGNYDGPCGYDTGHSCPANSPEIDPELGTGALVLIGGGAMVIRGRRKARACKPQAR